MSSNANISTALKNMSDANSDIVQLLLKLKAFLTDNSEITFDLKSGAITVPGIGKLVFEYKNGKFNSLTLGDLNNEVKLSVDSNGNLMVTDNNGNLKSVVCSSLQSSKISDSVIDSANIDNCTINSVIGSVRISGGIISLEQLKTITLKVLSLLEVSDIYATNISVDKSATVLKSMVYGDIRKVFKTERHIFTSNTTPIDNFADTMSYANGVWSMTDACNPSQLGYNLGTPSTVPDIIVYDGFNSPTDFESGHVYSKFSVTGWSEVAMNQMWKLSNVMASNISSNMYKNYNFTETPYFSALIGWPTGFYTPNHSGFLYIYGWSSDYIGKEVYYRTGGYSWPLYRTMTINKANNTATMGNITNIPAYSCVRVLLGIREDDNSLVYTMELG